MNLKSAREPLITYKGLHLSLAFFSLIFGLYLYLMVPEKKSEGKKMRLGEVVDSFPRIFKNTAFFLLLAYMTVTNFFPTVTVAVLELKFINTGFDKIKITNIETLQIPIQLFLSLVFSKMLKMIGTTMYIRVYHLLVAIAVL
jgi:hypothetical protein